MLLDAKSGRVEDAERVLRIEPTTLEIDEVGDSLGVGIGKWEGASRGGSLRS